VPSYQAGPHGAMRTEKLEKAPFYRGPWVELPATPSGTQEFNFPSGVMHSFSGARTSIVWYLKVQVIGSSEVGEHEHKVLVRPRLPDAV